MTAIVGLEHGGRVYMAADSAVSWGDDLVMVAREPKVWRATPPGHAVEMVMGVAGNSSVCEQLATNGWLPEFEFGTDTRYVVSELLPAAQDVADEFEMLVGINGVLWSVSGDGAAHTSSRGMMAIGSGSHLALGALAALFHVRPDRPAHCVQRALELIEPYSPSVLPPFAVVSSSSDSTA